MESSFTMPTLLSVLLCIDILSFDDSFSDSLHHSSHCISAYCNSKTLSVYFLPARISQRIRSSAFHGLLRYSTTQSRTCHATYFCVVHEHLNNSSLSFSNGFSPVSCHAVLVQWNLSCVVSISIYGRSRCAGRQLGSEDLVRMSRGCTSMWRGSYIHHHLWKICYFPCFCLLLCIRRGEAG